jgi:hypothetical protein
MPPSFNWYPQVVLIFSVKLLMQKYLLTAATCISRRCCTGGLSAEAPHRPAMGWLGMPRQCWKHRALHPMSHLLGIFLYAGGLNFLTCAAVLWAATQLGFMVRTPSLLQRTQSVLGSRGRQCRLCLIRATQQTGEWRLHTCGQLC